MYCYRDINIISILLLYHGSIIIYTCHMVWIYVGVNRCINRKRSVFLHCKLSSLWLCPYTKCRAGNMQLTCDLHVEHKFSQTLIICEKEALNVVYKPLKVIKMTCHMYSIWAVQLNLWKFYLTLGDYKILFHYRKPFHCFIVICVCVKFFNDAICCSNHLLCMFIRILFICMYVYNIYLHSVMNTFVCRLYRI